MQTHDHAMFDQAQRRSSRAPRWMMSVPLLVAAGAMAFGAVACGDDGGGAPKLPITTVQVAPLSAANVRSLADAWRAGGAWLEDAPFVTDMLGQVMAGFDVDDDDLGDPEPSDDDPSFADRLDTLADALEGDVFVTANVVSDDGTTLVYAIPLAAVCPEDDPDRADCESIWADQPIQLRVVSYHEGELTISVLVGTPPAEVASLTLAPSRLEASVSLSGLATLIRRVGALEDADEFQLDQLSGRVTASFEATGAQALKLAYGTDQITLRGSAEGTSFDVQIGRTSTVVVVDGATRTVDMGANVGASTSAVTLHDPDGAQADIRMNVDFPGSAANVHLDEDAATLAIDGLSLGSRATTVKLDGQTIIAVDLNASAGRKLDLDLHQVDASTLEIAVSPSLELSVMAAMQAVAGADAGWAANETLTVRLDGAPTPTVRTNDDRLEVVAGRMSYTSAARPDLSFTAEAGQCIAATEADGEDVEDEDAHPFEAFFVTSCD